MQKTAANAQLIHPHFHPIISIHFTTFIRHLHHTRNMLNHTYNIHIHIWPSIHNSSQSITRYSYTQVNHNGYVHPHFMLMHIYMLTMHMQMYFVQCTIFSYFHFFLFRFRVATRILHAGIARARVISYLSNGIYTPE